MLALDAGNSAVYLKMFEAISFDAYARCAAARVSSEKHFSKGVFVGEIIEIEKKNSFSIFYDLSRARVKNVYTLPCG